MNTKKDSHKTIIGRVEQITFPSLNGVKMHARIDTGAKTSSMWALSTEERATGLFVVFPLENGATVSDTFVHYSQVKVSSSMGHEQVRYKVRLSAVIKKRRIYATFTLADRSRQVYPVLIGRKILMRKFIVDVAKGSPLLEEEERRSAILQECIEEKYI